jgi:hypothetical protein
VEKTMGLDIRLPIGLLFAIFGALLAAYGLLSPESTYERSLGINVNLWWGLVLFAFGVIMLIMARLAAHPAGAGRAGELPEERTIEAQTVERPAGHPH